MRYLFTSLLALAFFILNAQPDPDKVDLQQIVDDLYGVQDNDINYEQLYENLALVLSHPLNLNKASAEDLRFLRIMSEQQIQSLLFYREEHGPLLSIYELQVIPHWSEESIEKVLPFVTVNEVVSHDKLSQRIVSERNNYFILRAERTLEEKEGFKESTSAQKRFLGSPEKLYARFRTARPGDFSLGFTLEKDAGEQITWNDKSKQYGADYISFHLQLQNKFRVNNLIVGDYQCQFGQGLVLGGAFGLGKGSETVTTARRTNIGFLPFTSANENAALRGLATTLQLASNLFLSGFYSLVNRDASVEGDSADDLSITSLLNTGYHRNQKELAGKSAINEKRYGAVINYKTRTFDAGVIYTTTAFQHRVQRAPSLYNQFGFLGNTMQNGSLFMNYRHLNFTFFSEVATSFNQGTGMVAGVLGSFSKEMDVAILYRNYGRNYHTLSSTAFSEGSTPQNENGFYWGWKYKFNRRYTISGYMDLFQFPWLKYRIYHPSQGHEWLIRFDYTPTKTIKIFAQLREEKKDRNLSDDPSPQYLTSTAIKRNYWLHAQYQINSAFRLRTRVQWSTFNFNRNESSGIALVQDIRYDLNRVSIIARHALFDTDDYDTRQYVYEDDVWLSFSLPAYHGTGIRNYFVLQYKLDRRLHVSVRYARTRFIDQKSIGDGLEKINGDSRNDIKVQIKLQL